MVALKILIVLSSTSQIISFSSDLLRNPSIFHFLTCHMGLRDKIRLLFEKTYGRLYSTRVTPKDHDDFLICEPSETSNEEAQWLPSAESRKRASNLSRAMGTKILCMLHFLQSLFGCCLKQIEKCNRLLNTGGPKGLISLLSTMLDMAEFPLLSKLIQ